jgi:hypothetical protein
LAERLLLARLCEAEGRGVTVSLRVLTEVLEAPIAIARTLGGFRVNSVELAEDGFDRGVEAAQVEAVEPDS